MTLKDLERFEQITIQCHDNPDADALAAGYGLYCYFTEKGKKTELVYSGRNVIQKSNLCIMLDKLKIPVQYIEPEKGNRIHRDGLLLTVDCQYGAGNVTGLTGDEIAIIDSSPVAFRINCSSSRLFCSVSKRRGWFGTDSNHDRERLCLYATSGKTVKK